MNKYDDHGWMDAAARESSVRLVDSMRTDGVTRLSPRGGAAEGAGGRVCGGERGDKSAGQGEGAVRGGGRLCASNIQGAQELVRLLRRVMFPGFFDDDPPWDGELDAHVSRLVSRVGEVLHDEVAGVVRYGRRLDHGAPGDGSAALAEMSDEAFSRHVVREFLASLPGVRGALALDVQAAYDGDPAAEHTDEIILSYPGLEAIFTHRVAHVLYRLGVPILPRVMSEQAHSRTGIDIHPGASVGESFFIDHGSATVIGETSAIGRHVKIYQGVTLGARSFPKDERGRVIRGIKRHPTIGDRVTIYAGAVILGGDTVIGDDCVIAGGVFVTSSVPAGHVVQQTRPELVLRPHGPAAGAGGNGKAGAPEAGTSGEGGERARFVPVPTSEAGWLDAGAGI